MHQFMWGFQEICVIFCGVFLFFFCISYPDSDWLHMKQTFNFGKRKEKKVSWRERDEGCRLTVQPLEFCFSRETSVRRTLCERKRCRCKATSCVPSKVPTVCFVPLPMGAVKWLGGIIDTTFDLRTFENKKSLMYVLFGWNNCLFFWTVKHFSADCGHAAGTRHCTLPRQIFTRSSRDSNPRKVWTPSVLLTYLLTPWCKVLLEQLTGLQLVKKFSAFHGIRRFITALTSVRHLC